MGVCDEEGWHRAAGPAQRWRTRAPAESAQQQSCIAARRGKQAVSASEIIDPDLCWLPLSSHGHLRPPVVPFAEPPCCVLRLPSSPPSVPPSSPLQAEDPSVKRASKHSPTALLAPTGLLSPVAPLPPTGLNPNTLSPGGPAFLAAAAAAGSPTAMHLPGMLAPMAPLRPANFSPVTNLRDNSPCNTLFIGNLGDNTSEQELRVLMGSQPGYRCDTDACLHALCPLARCTAAWSAHASLCATGLVPSDDTHAPGSAHAGWCPRVRLCLEHLPCYAPSVHHHPPTPTHTHTGS